MVDKYEKMGWLHILIHLIFNLMLFAINWENFTVAVVSEGSNVSAQVQFVIKGRQLLLNCQYNASPPVSEVQWQKNGTVIARNHSVEINDSRVTIPHYNESQVQLVINATTPQDTGNYTCLVINNSGNLSDTTSIIIQGVCDYGLYIISNNYQRIQVKVCITLIIVDGTCISVFILIRLIGQFPFLCFVSHNCQIQRL